MRAINSLKRLVINILPSLLLIIITSCVKQPQFNPKSEAEELIIPAGFDWRSVKEINLNVSVISINAINDNSPRIIKVFKNGTLKDSELIASGSASPGSPFKATLSLSLSLPQLYIMEILPDGGRNIKTVNVTGNSISVAFSNSISSESLKPASPNFTGGFALNTAPYASMALGIDADGDGIPIGVDIDDNDPEVAFASFFPSAMGWSTFIFEDMWPEQGDYDLNDIVIALRVTYLTNASNLVTRLRVDYNLRGAGSTYNNAAAFQLTNVSPANIKSVTGRLLNGNSPFAVEANGAETGVTPAVIPLFNNQRDFISFPYFLNTINGDHKVTPNNHLIISFNTPVNQSELAMDRFNLFIVPKSREREVHLPTGTATSKFNGSLADGHNISPSNKFKTKQGMMWALMLPEDFKYPSERRSILKAYPKFRDWATSGGTLNTNWYSSGVSGNLVMQYIYQPAPQLFNLPTVVTAAVLDITPSGAKAGGEVTDDGGATVFERGLCWKTSPGATIADSKLVLGFGSGAFEGFIAGLNQGTTYYLKAYAINEKGTSYGSEVSFALSSEPAPPFPETTLSPVKIGGVWWAPVNAGYSSTRLYGLLYQWSRMYGQRGQFDAGGSFSNASAPVSPAEANNPANANRFYIGLKDWSTTFISVWSMTLYNPCPAGWRVPTGDELDLLINSGSSWVGSGGGGVDNLAGRWFGPDHSGARVNSVFLPAGGFRNISSELSNRGVAGYYWPVTANPQSAGDVQNLYFTIDNPGQRFNRDKVNGYSVRCVNP